VELFLMTVELCVILAYVIQKFTVEIGWKSQKINHLLSTVLLLQHKDLD
jgi:hypothetical protein